MPATASMDKGQDEPSTQARPRPNRTSCDLCKRMKIKCERIETGCVTCDSRGVDCSMTFSESKKRIRKMSYSEDVRSRLERLESIVAASGIDPTTISDMHDVSTRKEDELPKDVTDRLSTLVISEGGTARFMGPSSGFSLFSPQGFQWVSERTGTSELTELISLLTKAKEKPLLVNHLELWQTMPADQRAPLPSREIMDACVMYFFDTFNFVLPLFDRTTFDAFYDLQLAQQPAGGQAWYACLNLVICLGSLIWSAHGTEQDHELTGESGCFDHQESFKYFRNACSCLTDLMFKDCSLMAVQAIVGIAFIQETTHDPQPFYFLVAAASRLAQSMGLHRKLDHAMLSPAEVNQRRNVFWIIYFLDKSIALRVGHSSVIVDDDIGVDLPRDRNISDAALGTRRFETFRSHAELAMLESRIYSELYTVKARNRSHLERLKSVGELDNALLEWREKLPIEVRPSEPILCAKEQKIPVIMLHFSYFFCLMTIHRVSNWSSWTGQPARRDWLSLNGEHLSPRIYASHSICLSAARASIELLRMVDVRAGSARDHLIWMALYYPLSGFLILFANLLQNPQSPHVKDDLCLMELVRSFISPRPMGSTSINAFATLEIVTELVNVAKKFVDKVNSQGLNTAKRLHRSEDEEKLSQRVSAHSIKQSTIKGYHGISKLSLTPDPSVQALLPTTTHTPPNPSASPGEMAKGHPQSSPIPPTVAKPQQPPQPPPYFIETFPRSTTLNELLPSTGNAGMGFAGNMGDINGQGMEAELFLDPFDWDLGSFWTSDFTKQSYSN